MMWLVGLLVLAVAALAGGALVGLAWYWFSPVRLRPKKMTAAAVPFGCLVLVLAAPLAMTLLTPIFEDSDRELYEEIFGKTPSTVDQGMLSDEFGRGGAREIYMWISPSEADRADLLNLPGLRPSNTTLGEFERRGDQHGFIWWATTDPSGMGHYCEPVRLLEADGFRGWGELRIAECGGADPSVPPGTHGETFYVIASGRQ